MGGICSKRSTSKVADEAAKKFASADCVDSVVENMSEVQLDEFRDAFNAFDLDGGGSIDKVELGALFRSLGKSVSDTDMDNLMAAADADGSGSVEFEEFAVLMAHLMQVTDSATAQMETLKNAFSVFDADGSGSIDSSEMKRIMINLGESVEDADVNEIIDLFDTDGDGQVDYDEFCAGILEKKLFTTHALRAMTGDTS